MTEVMEEMGNAAVWHGGVLLLELSSDTRQQNDIYYQDSCSLQCLFFLKQISQYDWRERRHQT